MPAAGVIVAVRGAGEGAVVAAVGAAPGLAVVRRCADLAEALAAGQASLASAVVLSPQPGLDRDTLARFAAAGVAAVGVAAGPDEAAGLAALGLRDGSSDVVATIAEALAEAAVSPRAPVPSAVAPLPPRGVVIAVWGTHGAPGRTTVAVNIAAEIAAAGSGCLLVDLDTHAPSIATALGMEEDAVGVAAVAHGAVRGGDAGELVARHTRAVSPHLAVLVGLARATRWSELSGAALAPVWPALRAAADVVVVDVAAPVEEDPFAADPRGAGRNAATLAALAEADAVIAVGSAEPRQLQRLASALLDHEGSAPLVVVNRVRASVAGERPEQAIATLLGRLAGVPEIWPLPWDPRACDRADREGRTLAEAAPRSPLHRSLRALAVGALDVARAARASLVEPRAVTD